MPGGDWVMVVLACAAPPHLIAIDHTSAAFSATAQPGSWRPSHSVSPTVHSSGPAGEPVGRTPRWVVRPAPAAGSRSCRPASFGGRSPCRAHHTHHLCARPALAVATSPTVDRWPPASAQLDELWRDKVSSACTGTPAITTGSPALCPARRQREVDKTCCAPRIGRKELVEIAHAIRSRSESGCSALMRRTAAHGRGARAKATPSCSV